MKKVDKAILLDIAWPFLITLAVFTFIIFARQLGPLAELLITKDASFSEILQISLALFPNILVFAVPIAFLSGVLIAFSRMSSDREVVALRAGGVSLARLARPVLGVGAVVSLVTLVLSVWLLPWGNNQVRELRYRISLKSASGEVRPRVFYEDLPDTILYVEETRGGGRWRHVFIASLQNGEQQVILARRGNLFVPEETGQPQIHVEQGYLYNVNSQAPERDNVTRFDALDLPVRSVALQNVAERRRVTAEKSTRELLTAIGRNENRQRNLVELHRRFALATAPLLFSLLGVPLGVTTHKGGRASGFVLSMLVVIVYYISFMGGLQFAMVGKVPPGAGLWAVNVAWGIAGVALLWLANREVVRFSGFWQTRGFSFPWESLGAWLGKRLGLRWRRKWPSLPQLRGRVAQVADWYIVQGFLTAFLITLAGCLTLYLVALFFDLIDDILRRQVALTLVLRYFQFLLPELLILLTPLTILLATLIHFGILEKTSQVTAFKAGGVSLYRLAAPVLVVSLLACICVYLLQDFIVPYSNQKQDGLRSLIKGHPPATSLSPEHRWIMGEQNRIYNYHYFDPQHPAFAGLSVFELKENENRLARRIFAERARWDPTHKGWTLEKGWTRDFEGTAQGYQQFERATFLFPEGPDYFTRDVKESSKMTYAELRTYIDWLRQSGVEVTELQVELHRKISFPLATLIMALIGIPFSFSMGKRGALYGIAAGVLIGIVYWGAFGLFETLGTAGLLSPLLAAWAPNLLFSSGGLYLLLTLKT